MHKLINLVKKNYFLIILVIGIILITAINISLRIKLKECSDSRLDSSIEKINMEVDSLEGFSLPKDLIIAINKTNIPKSNNLDVGTLIFTKPEKSCGKCLLSILSDWLKNQSTNKSIANLKPVVVLNKDDKSFIGALESLGYNKNLRIEINADFVKNITPGTSEGVCLFINNQGKIIFAKELRTENTERIKRTFKKIINYLSDTSLNEYKQISIPLISKIIQ